MSKASQTPVMRQYLAAKEAHRDALLFFRMGDFYELFYDDAVVAARALDLTLTARNKGAEDEVPMAGVPYHAASSYVQRLLEQGFKVAICEQMADPSKVKGIVPREVVRVASPGIAYDDAGIEARQNHYLVAVERAAAVGPFGIAALDLSTGELSAC
jgi:DNA mismatch repair protein MutS